MFLGPLMRCIGDGRANYSRRLLFPTQALKRPTAWLEPVGLAFLGKDSSDAFEATDAFQKWEPIPIEMPT